MKKKILSLGMAIVLIICAFATLSACGRKLKDREITPTIEDIWQDHTGMVYAEVGNLGDYLKDKDAGKEMHFSINGGEWFRGFSWRESEDNPGKCIYAFLSTKSEEEKITEYLTEGESLHIQPGTTINVSARTPENYYYKPSAESERKTYTLKSKLQNALSWYLPISRFSRDVDSSGVRFSDDAETQDEKKFVFYYHKSNPRIVEIGVPASTWDESEKMYRHYIRELTEEEKATVAGFGLEYKVIPYNEKYLKTHDDGVKSVNGSFLEQEENEGKPSVYGWTSMLNLQESHVWEFMPNDAMQVKGFVFLVRQKATKDAVQSQTLAFWYNYNWEIVGEYRKITAEQAYEMMNTQEVVIVDVRTQSEYDEGHIQNAVLIPNETIGSEPPTNLPDKNAIILVYCRSGRRSEEAARKLVNLGYVIIYDFGGINDWTYGTVTD